MRAAGWVALAFYCVAIGVQVAVRTGAIPVTSIAGGYLPSLEAHLPVFVMNVVVSAIGVVFVVLASGIGGERNAGWYRIAGWTLTVYWTAGFLMQLIGTDFERTYLAWLALIGALAHLRIAVRNPAKAPAAVSH